MDLYTKSNNHGKRYRKISWPMHHTSTEVLKRVLLSLQHNSIQKKMVHTRNQQPTSYMRKKNLSNLIKLGDETVLTPFVLTLKPIK